jgi:hypothetical protein
MMMPANNLLGTVHRCDSLCNELGFCLVWRP